MLGNPRVPSQAHQAASHLPSSSLRVPSQAHQAASHLPSSKVKSQVALLKIIMFLRSKKNSSFYAPGSIRTGALRVRSDKYGYGNVYESMFSR